MTRSRELAIQWHSDQKYGEHPYVYHLDKVAELVRPFGEEAVTVAYLHDVIEDTAITSFDIADIFGGRIAMMVEVVTDPKGENRRERKKAANKKLSEVSVDSVLAKALIVKVADRLANVREAYETGSKGKLSMYSAEHVAFHKAAFRPGLCPTLWEQLEQYLDSSDGHILSRMEKRGNIYPRGVLQVCQDVHMASTGASERDPAEQAEDIKLLQTVLKTWDSRTECCFDRAVKTLVGITIAETMP